jgi:NTP pyrophosphatase (non-canonical NTP hydrolase)
VSAPNWKNNRMNPWLPTLTPHQARRIGKTTEELGELMAVCGRLQIQGLHEVDPSSGKTNINRLSEEIADVLAQLRCNLIAFSLDVDGIEERAAVKFGQMAQWEQHYTLAKEPGHG